MDAARIMATPADANGVHGNGACVAMNAANEVAVAAFLKGRCRFLDIPRLVEAAMQSWRGAGPFGPLDLQAILQLDAGIRTLTENNLDLLPATFPAGMPE